MFETLPFSVRQTFRVLTPGFFFLLSFSPSSFFRFLILSFFVLFSGIAKQVQDNSRRSNKRSGIRGEKSFSLQAFLPAPYLEGPALKGIVPPDHIASPVRAGISYRSEAAPVCHRHHSCWCRDKYTQLNIPTGTTFPGNRTSSFSGRTLNRSNLPSSNCWKH